jgi:hypothetical protein
MRHTIALLGGALSVVCALAWSSAAVAQEVSYLRQSRAAPTNALELKVATGYTQGFGAAAPGRTIADVAGAGIGIEGGADYRMDPTVSLGLQGGYQEYRNGLNTNARGFTTSAGVTLHATPLLRGDPWLRIGAGYRLLWDVNPPGTATTVRHGFELARATLGYDVRLSDAIAIAPELGGDLNVFLWQTRNGVDSALASGRFGVFLFAGVQGRFDVLGQTSYGLRSSLSAAELMQ